jgi:hypothetical protein
MRLIKRILGINYSRYPNSNYPMEFENLQIKIIPWHSDRNQEFQEYSYHDKYENLGY